MELNLLYWKVEGQAFLNRIKIWYTLLDPGLILTSTPEIERIHSALGGVHGLCEKDGKVLKLSLSTVHADSDAPFPFIFRPPAFLPVAGPLVTASLAPYKHVMPAMVWQCLFQSYMAGFNYANRNCSSQQQTQKPTLKELLLIAGTVSYATLAGAFPYIFIINRLSKFTVPLSEFLRTMIPLVLASFSVLTVRREESDNGVQVFDSNGNCAGISREAGKKAVKETALSRVLLLGTTSIWPNVLILLLHKRRLFQKNPLLLRPLRNTSTIMLFGLMIPVSFSVFPQLGTIKKEHLEKNLQAAAVDGKLFYHRGL